MAKRALITGILGMDSSCLAEYLIGLGYDVYGLYKRVSTGINFDNIELIRNHQRLHLIEGDITDASLMTHLIQDLKPDELYCLAAQSHVGYSFENPMETWRTNTESVQIQLDAIRRHSKSKKFYFSGLSEVFGTSKCPEGGFDETTVM